MGYVPYSSCLPLFVAVEEGYFKQVGLDVEVTKFQTANEVMNALATGRIDGIGGIGLPTYFAVEQNTPGLFKICWLCAETKEKSVNSFLARKDSDLSSLADLTGKRVGTFTGSTQVLNVRLILAKFMDPDKDVTIVQVSPQLQIQALVSKQFDALFTIEPIPTIAVEQGVARVLVDNPRCKYIQDPFPAGAAVLASKFVAAHPEEADKARRAMEQALDFIEAHEAAAKTFLPKYTPLAPELAEKSRLYDWWKLGEADQAAVQGLADLLYKGGELKARVETANLYLAAGKPR